VLVFLARGLVQRYLYDQDLTGWLAVARLAMGYPLTIGALAVSVLAVRRVRAVEAATAEAATDETAAATAETAAATAEAAAAADGELAERLHLRNEG
jgi:hypothetical protein